MKTILKKAGIDFLNLCELCVLREKQSLYILESLFLSNIYFFIIKAKIPPIRATNDASKKT